MLYRWTIIRFFMLAFCQHVTMGAQYPPIDYPVHDAIKTNDWWKFCKLVENGANVNHYNLQGLTPLHVAVACKRPCYVTKLMDYKLDYLKADNQGDVPLHYAMKNGDYAIIALLFKKTDWTYRHVYSEQSFLHYAVEYELEKLVITLTAMGSPLLDAGDIDGDSPLHCAALWRTSSAILDDLIQKGACVNQKNKSWMTPLFYAVQSNNLDIVKVLYFNGAHLDSQDRFGRTPLHYAVLGCQKDMMRFLIQHNAITNCPDFYNKTPLYYARQHHPFRTDIINLLTLHEGISYS